MTKTADRVMVPGYRHVPGNHCGSTALRNLLGFHGVEISEEMAFGLGAGACFYYVVLDDASPTRWFNGRTARLEENFDQLTGAALQLRTFDQGDDSAWKAAREEVDAGNPVLLLTDLYYLDHYGNSAHFPGHAVVLAGYDEEVAMLSDTGFEELLRVAGGLAAFSGFYFAVAMLTDTTYREEFLSELTSEMQASFRARVEYLRVRRATA